MGRPLKQEEDVVEDATLLRRALRNGRSAVLTGALARRRRRRQYCWPWQGRDGFNDSRSMLVCLPHQTDLRRVARSQPLLRRLAVCYVDHYRQCLYLGVYEALGCGIKGGGGRREGREEREGEMLVKA